MGWAENMKKSLHSFRLFILDSSALRRFVKIPAWVPGLRIALRSMLRPG
jgi:hypothetical protein